MLHIQFVIYQIGRAYKRQDNAAISAASHAGYIYITEAQLTNSNKSGPFPLLLLDLARSFLRHPNEPIQKDGGKDVEHNVHEQQPHIAPAI